MDKRKKKKTNKKRRQSQELSIGNLRKTELNCSQCQKQLFGLWKNESFQSCLECSGKKKNVLTMLKSMNRVYEVQLGNQIVDSTVVKSMSDTSNGIEQNKDEKNDYVGRNRERSEKRYMKDLENKSMPPDVKRGEKISRTRRSLNLSHESDQYEDNGKSNYIPSELESINNEKTNIKIGSVADIFENGSTITDSLRTTRRRSSLEKAVDELLKSDVSISPEGIQDVIRSKRGRSSSTVCTNLAAENNSDEKISEQRRSNKRRQQASAFEENDTSKLAKGRKRGKDSEEVKDDNCTSTDKLPECQPNSPVGNVSFSDNESMNTNKNRRRKQSAKEIILSGQNEEIYETRNPRKSGRIHCRNKSPEAKSCDNKIEEEAQTDEGKGKQRSTNSTEIKRLKIDMENYNISCAERVKRRSLYSIQNTSPERNKSLVGVQTDMRVDNSKRRTRFSLNVTPEKTTPETKPVEHTVLDVRVSSIPCRLEDGNELKEIKENKRERKKFLETELVSTKNKGKRQGSNLVTTKQKPLVSARTLELLRTTKGMKPVVLVEKITLKDKVAQQSTTNKKTRQAVIQNKTFNKKLSNQRLATDNVEPMKMNKQLSLKNETLVDEEGSNTNTEESHGPKQKPIALRTVRKKVYNQSNLVRLNGNNIRRSERQNRKKVVRKYQSLRLRALKKKSSTVRTSASKDTKQKPRYFPCAKCKKQFVNALQQKSHELLHRGYFDLILRRIDSETINKPEGEIISKGIVNYLLKSVFEQADVHPCLPEQRYNHSTETNKYKLKHLQVKLKRFDLQEALSLSKYNEGVLVATTIVNDIVKNIDNTKDKDYTSNEATDTGLVNYNQIREAESLNSKSRVDNQRVQSIQNIYLYEDARVHSDFTMPSDYEQQTDSLSQQLKHSEDHNEEDDMSRVISNNGNEKEQDRSNDTLETDDRDVCVDVHENNLGKNQCIGYVKKITETRRVDCYSDMNLDQLTKFSNKNVSGESPRTSIDGIEALITSNDTHTTTNSNFFENTVILLKSRNNDMDSVEPGACEIQEGEKMNGKIKVKQEVITNGSAVVNSTEGDKCVNLNIKTDECFDGLVRTKRQDENIKAEVNEADNECGKKEPDRKLQDITSNKEVISSDVTSNVDEINSDETLAIQKTLHYSDDDDDRGGGGDEDDDEGEDEDDDGEDEDDGDDDDDDYNGSGDERASVKSVQSEDEVDIGEANKNVSSSHWDIVKVPESSADTSVDDIENKDNEIIGVTAHNESPDIISNIHATGFKELATTDSMQKESSIIEHQDKVNNPDKDSVEVSSEVSNVADDDESVDTDSDTGTDIYEDREITYDFSNHQVSRHDLNNYKPENSEIIVKSKESRFNEPSKRETDDILEYFNEKENKKSVSENENADNVSANFIPSKQETKFVKSSSQEQLTADLSGTHDDSETVISQHADTITTHDSTEIRHNNMPCEGNRNEQKSSITLVQRKRLENVSSTTDNKNKQVSESTLETETTSEANYKNVEKYLESFIKDFIVRNTENSESNIEKSFDSEQGKLVPDEIGKSDADVLLSDLKHQSNITSCYVIPEKSNVDNTPTKSVPDYGVTEKSHLYNDPMQNVAGMFGQVCSSLDMQREVSQNLTVKESCTSSGSAVKPVAEQQVQMGGREGQGSNDYIKSAETGDDVYTHSDVKGNLVSPATYVSDRTTCRLSGSEVTKHGIQGQYYNKNESDFSATSIYSTGNTGRQSGESMQTAVPSTSNHVTYTVQKQSCDRREIGNSTNSSNMNATRRYSGDNWSTDSASAGLENTRRHSNDRRDVDYSIPGASNAYQRPITDNRRQYVDPYENRGYMDSRDNRGNSYGTNWKYPVQNRAHPYQHNAHKRNERGGYSNWRWPGQNNYSHYRHGNNWR